MITVYEQKETNFLSYGLGVLRDVTSCLVTEELNSRYEVEIEYKITDQSEEILIENNIIKVPVKDKEQQLFRITHIEKRLYSGYLLGVHISYDLNNNFLEDSYVRNKDANASLNKILNDAQFQHHFLGTSEIATISSARYVRKNLLEALFSADNSFVTRWGGFIIRDNFKLYHKAKGSRISNLVVEYGKNLREINFKIDISELATRIMPQGTEGLLLPEKYIDSNLINNYPSPIIRNIKYDDIGIKEEEDEVVTYDEACEMLRERVQQEYLLGIDKPKLSVEIDFVELSKTEEYKSKGYKNLEKVIIGDIVKAKVEHLKLEKELQVISIVYNVLLEKIETITLGEEESSYFNKTQETLTSEISYVLNTELPSSIQKARLRISEEIKNAMGGYVYKTNEELFIMDEPELNQAQKIWRWNLNGLAYTDEGINGEYRTAITQKGEIVADFITAGVLDGNVIKAGSIDISNLSQDTKNELVTNIGTYNQIRNSVGINGLQYWIHAGEVFTEKGDEISEKTESKSAFILNTGTLEQLVPVVEGEDYTFSLRLMKGTGIAQIKLINANEEYDIYIDSEETQTDWIIRKHVFISQSKSIKIEINNTNSYLIVSDLMLIRGKYSKPWSQHSDEIYSDKVVIDTNGIRIENTGNMNKLIADTTDFGIYKGNETMFQVGGERVTARNLYIPQSPNSKLSLGPVDVIIRTNGVDFTFNT